VPGKSWRVRSEPTHRRRSGFSSHLSAFPCRARNTSGRNGVNTFGASLRHNMERPQVCDARVDRVVVPVLHGRPVKTRVRPQTRKPWRWQASRCAGHDRPCVAAGMRGTTVLLSWCCRQVCWAQPSLRNSPAHWHSNPARGGPTIPGPRLLGACCIRRVCRRNSSTYKRCLVDHVMPGRCGASVSNQGREHDSTIARACKRTCVSQCVSVSVRNVCNRATGYKMSGRPGWGPVSGLAYAGVLC
jgi:hypothetical protein